MVTERPQIPDSSILVVVDDANSAGALLGWSLYQACRRHSRLHVLYAPDFPHTGDRQLVDPATA